MLIAAAVAHSGQTGRVMAQAGIRTGMTWTVMGQSGLYVHVGADAQTNPYAGDTTINQSLPILCVLVDSRPAPSHLVFDAYNGWARGEVRVTPPIPATVLTSQAAGDEICADTFDQGWRLAEFHDGRHGTAFTASGGWTFWAAGQLPPGTRFWVAINDQPANPWNSQGSVPVVSPPKFFPSEAPVPNQFMAMFREDTPESNVEALANGLVAQYGGTIIDVFPAVLGFSFNASDAQALAISADSRVESVDQDGYGQPTQAAPWHLDRVDQRPRTLNGVYAPINDGSGVNLYILDTGFRRTHQEFGGRAFQAVDFIRFLGQRDDCDGHGTAVGSAAAGDTVGVARRATLISVRIAGCRGNAYNPLITVFNSTIVAGLDWVTRNHVKPAVANVSYSVPPGFWRRWFRSKSPTDRAAARAVRAGVTVVAAAGDSGRAGRGGKNADKSSPARASDVISVSGTDWNDRRVFEFNWGKVDLFAPGLQIVVAALTSDTALTPFNGTSLAAPLVAGAAALYLHDHPTASPAEVRNALQTQATQGVVVDPGGGSANRMLFVNITRPATHAGLTWAAVEQRGGVVHVAADGQSNVYAGDTPSTAARPILCLLVDGSAVPAGITPDFYNGWARGQVRLSPAVFGTQLTSRAVADGICAATFGAAWRMAEFHDGRYGPSLAQSGGWSFWAFGTIPTGTRFWTAINDQPANPWN